MFQKLETETFWGSHTVHTVSRGFLCSRVEEKWNEIRKLADDTDIEELTKFVCNLKDSDNFGGVLHRNTFKVNKKVGIISLGFFGPHDEDMSSYDVDIIVENQPRKRVRTLYSTQFYGVPAKKRQIFYVTFNRMIVIEPNGFYTIGFELDGPNTGILDPKLVKSVSNSDVEFTFLRGSMQMPEIKYVVLE